MGVVYLSRHPQLGFEVAIKVLLAAPSARPAQLERFRRELAALAQLQHSGLVDVLEAGEREGRPWFAMRRVTGSDLEDRIQTQGVLPPSEVIELGVQLCQAVGHAHSRGLLHRDLKPENVLCGPGGRYVVTDFGLTKSLEDSAQSLSKTGTIQGTPGFWAPEQASGKGKLASPRTDVYGVGATLYAALTGEPPVRGASVFELMVAACGQAPLPPSQLVSLPKPLEAAVLKCLAKSPEDRFQSLGELEAELERVRAEASAERGPAWAWVLLGLGGATLALLAARGVEDAPPGSPVPSAQAQLSPTAPVGIAQATPAPPSSEELASLHRAAEAGQSEAMLSLAKIYSRGNGVPADPRAGRSWYRRAAEAGNTRAMVALGIRLLAIGDLDQAVPLFRRAAEAGDAKGMAKLGICYLRLPGFDSAEGVRWLRRSAQKGNTEAMVNLGIAYTKGQATPEDLREAATWYRKAAEAGNVLGMTRLAAAFARGQGVPRDGEKSVRWCRQAVAKGNTEAMIYLGEAYERGLGVERDDAEALRWYRRAAREGDAVAYYCIGILSLEGRGVPKDPAEAARLFRLSAAENHAASFGQLAGLYVQGLGVPRDVQRGLEFYHRGAIGGDPNSRYAYGVILYNGTLVKRDLPTAQRLLDAADGIYAAYFAFLCRSERGDAAGAHQRLRADASGRELKDWHRALADFLLGDLSEARLFKLTSQGKTSEDRRARRCEANFYAAALCALAENLGAASWRLERCLENRVEGYKEVAAAEALLRRIKTVPGPR